MPGKPESDSIDITLLLGELQNLDEDAAAAIWNEYFPKVMNLARKKMRYHARRTYDEEDIALSAINSFFEGVRKNHFDGLRDRDEIWRLLITITVRKANAHRKKANAQKRGGGDVRGESVFVDLNGDPNAAGLGQVIDENRMPEFADDVVRCCEELLESLPNDNLRQTALLRMEGHTVDEIAAKMECSRSRTKQRIARIKEIWGESS